MCLQTTQKYLGRLFFKAIPGKFMEKNTDFFVLGKVLKTFGSKGELIFHFDLSIEGILGNASFVFLDLDGSRVPFFIESFHPKNDQQALVKLADVDSLEEAETYVGTELLLPQDQLPESNDENILFQKIIGYQVVDAEKGNIGTIAQVLEYPSQWLFEIHFQGKEILIPIVDEIVTRIDSEKKVVEITAPDGLIDLYLGEKG